MGKLIWSQWAHLIGLTAGTLEVVGGIFGIFYRISMFGHLTSEFNPLFYPLNIESIVCIVLGLILLGIETPVFPFKNTFFTTSYFPRIILYFFFGAISILNYQTVNPGLYMIIASLMYITAAVKGENRRSDNRSGSKV